MSIHVSKKIKNMFKHGFVPTGVLQGAGWPQTLLLIHECMHEHPRHLLPPIRALGGSRKSTETQELCQRASTPGKKGGGGDAALENGPRNGVRSSFLALR